MLKFGVVIFAANFTAGMISALFFFAFRLGYLIYEFSPNLISGLIFFVTGTSSHIAFNSETHARVCV